MYPILFLLLLNSFTQVVGGEPLPPPTDPAYSGSVPLATVASDVAPAVVELQSDLDRLIRVPGWRNDEWGILVLSLDRGDTLYAHRPDAALAPASNLKLFTSAAALYYLGPEFRYSTYLMTDGAVTDGVLDGNLILYGTGDPTISDRFYPSKTTVWEAFADTLVARGIREIRGDIIGDASYFEDEGVGMGWQESYMNAAYAAPASALSFNENIVTLFIRPGEEPGWRPTIRLIPGGEGIALVNQATTVRSGRTVLDVTRAAYDGPIVVRGQIATGNPGVWSAVPVADPARYSAAVLREVLVGRGIQVHGGIRSVHSPEESPVTGRSVFAPAFDKTPPLRVLAIHQSPRLQEILEVVNKKSHNLYAEAVLRTVGRVALGEGTVAGGERAVRYLMECETGADTPTLAMFDGSGLSVLNRASPRETIRLLSYIFSSPLWESFWETLPEAGNAQGLRRMYRTAAERNLRAKTGTIDRVSALSGYVRAANGEHLAFSIMSNNVPSTWRAKRVEDAIGARLASFRRPAGAVTTSSAGSMTQPASGQPSGSVMEAAEPAADGARTHVIRWGDTLEGIAKRYGTTVRALQEANPGVTPRRLIPGRKLRIP